MIKILKEGKLPKKFKYIYTKLGEMISYDINIVYKDDTVKKYVSISKTVPYTTIFIEGFKNYSEQEDGEEYSK